MPHKDPEQRRAYLARTREHRLAVKREWTRRNAARLNEVDRERYNSDPAYRDKLLADQRRYRQEHLDDVRARDRARRAADPEKFRARQKATTERHKDRIKQYQAQWRIGSGKQKERDRIAKWNAANVDRRRAIARAYAKRNPEKYRAACHKRRAIKKGAEIGDRVAYVSFVRQIRRAEQAFCYWCGKSVPKRQRHIDHIVPLDAGGPDDVHNLCCSCSQCNRRKGKKQPHEFSGQMILTFPVVTPEPRRPDK